MFDFEGGHILEGVPGLEGGKEPGHMTASCAIAGNDFSVLGHYCCGVLFSKTQKGNTFAMHHKRDGQETKRGVPVAVAT